MMAFSSWVYRIGRDPSHASSCSRSGSVPGLFFVRRLLFFVRFHRGLPAVWFRTIFAFGSPSRLSNRQTICRSFRMPSWTPVWTLAFFGLL